MVLFARRTNTTLQLVFQLLIRLEDVSTSVRVSSKLYLVSVDTLAVIRLMFAPMLIAISFTTNSVKK